MKHGIGETLKLAAKAKSKEKKIELLHDAYRKCGSPMITYLKYALKDDIKWLLPEGEPPYKPLAKATDSQAQMYIELRKMKNFMLGGNHPNMKQSQREQIFIQTLEALDPDDAEFIVLMKDKKLFKGLTKETVQAAFPVATKGWFKENNG